MSGFAYTLPLLFVQQMNSCSECLAPVHSATAIAI